jgi:FKBP-type peptidyl-prolyl cis-trans isomerase
LRTRFLPAAAALVAVGLLATGCSLNLGDPQTPSPTDTPKAGCLMDLKSGETSDSIGVSGSGADVKLTVPEDAKFAELERTVVSRGTGDDVVSGDLVTMAYQIVLADDDEVVDSSKLGEDGVVAMLLSAADVPVIVVALECLPVGSEVILTVPGSDRGEGESDLVLYAKTVEKLPVRAMGEVQAPVADMPTVKLAENGAPTITIPDAPAFTQTKLATLIQGSGAVVQPGDYVIVQYVGVKWEDGEVFDGSWTRGTPAGFATNQVVKGFSKALEGYQVGSQVLVVMPPEEGYGAVAGHALQKNTLVFVVDILAIAK